jgi:uncharacterized membrane protein YidH (DUF202 family)
MKKDQCASKRPILAWPQTRLGWWAVGLTVAFLALFTLNFIVIVPAEVFAPWRQTILPVFGISMLLMGLAGGVVALLAVILRRERALPLWFCLLFGLLIVVFLLGEFLIPH